MLTKRAARERGTTETDWLNSHHSFSFGHYYDPTYMGYSDLRVINEDRVIAGAGFGTHGHKDMEIITYVLSGALAHKDSMGNGSTITHGDVQIMSAGTGVTHSEFNASSTDPVHFLQMWVLPDEQGAQPRYQERSFDEQLQQGGFVTVIAPEGDNALHIRQNARLLIGRMSQGKTETVTLATNRKAWVHVASGEVSINDQAAHAGDGVAVQQESELTFNALQNSEILIFDLTA